MTIPRRPRPSERSLVEAGARYLEAAGYRTWVNPDGSDYFDLVARRRDEVGLVEAKVGDSRKVLAQALARRAWGDWVAVLLVPRRGAERLEERTRSSRAAPVGVWTVEEDRVQVVRAARPWVVPGEPDPYAELRTRFLRLLDAVERGEIPSGIAWDSVPGSVRAASHGRKFREWRLDEPRADQR